jgi:hypothetical protein
MAKTATQQEFQPPQPGREHEIFLKDVGTWDATVEIRLTPGGAPQVSKGVASNRVVSEGHWLVTEFRNETTGFEGHGIYGWDPAKGKYVGVWVDNMRSFVALAEGSWDANTKTMTLWTEAPGPGGKPVRWREATQTVNSDTQVFRSYLPLPDGGEFELMTVTYKRRT